MAKRNKLALMSSAVSMAAQMIYLLVNFVLRRFFIQYFGMEILGINGVLADVLNTLSLADLGVQSAITFRMYKPLARGQEAEVNEIITLFRKVYWAIGSFIILGGLCCMPFLPFLVTDVSYSMAYIRFAFFLQLLVSASTYFLAYKRTLLYADQKQYLCSLVDIACNLCFALVKFAVIIIAKNYFVYLGVQILQNVISNLIVHQICRRKYRFLNVKAPVGKDLKRNLFGDVKNVFAGKLATYVYGSTDNLVISALISTVSVGYLSSYKYITDCLMSIVYYMMMPIQPMIGNYLVDEGLDRAKKLFHNYTFVRYFFAFVLLVPALCLADNFIAVWIGPECVMTPWITCLLVADTYISIVYGPTGEYIEVKGLFAQEKRIMLLAAALNIVLSVAGVFVIGIYGVLVGTVICQIVLWIGKSTVVFRRVLMLDKKEIAEYWAGQLKGLLLFVGTAVLGKWIISQLFQGYSWLSFIVNGGILVLLSAGMVSLFYCRTSGFAYMMGLIRTIAGRFGKGGE